MAANWWESSPIVAPRSRAPAEQKPKSADWWSSSPVVKAKAPPAEAPVGEADEETKATLRRWNLPPPATREERKAWGDTFKAIPTQVGASLTQVVAGILADQASEVEQMPTSFRFADEKDLTDDQVAQKRREITNSYLDVARAAQADLDFTSGAAKTFGQRAVLNTAQSIPQSAGAMAIGLITRNPELAAAAMYPTTAGQSFGQFASGYQDAAEARNVVGATFGQPPPSKEQELAQRQRDFERARFHARVQGALETATEELPFTALLKKGSPAAQRLVEVLAQELPGESIATITQTLDQTIAQDTPEGGATVEDVLKGLQEGFKQLPDTWAATILQSTLQSGFVSGAERLARGRAQAEPETAPAPEAPPAQPEPPPGEAMPGAPGLPEEIERYQFMKRDDGKAPQMEIAPLTQERFIKYVRPTLPEGYANTLEDYQQKHPNATHVALTRSSPDAEWQANWVDSSEGMVNRLRRHEAKLRQVPDFESKEASDWGAIEEKAGTRRDINAVDPKTDSLAAAVAKMGGLSRDQAEKEGIDPAEFGRRGAGLKLVFTNDGEQAENLAEKLAQRGYPVTDETGSFSGQVLLDRLNEEISGKTVRTASGTEAAAEKEYAERTAAENRRWRDQQAEAFAAYPPEYHGEPVEHTLGADEDYPAEFDQQAKNLTDLAVMAREHADEDTVQDALHAGTDAQAARELWEIVNRGRQTEPSTSGRAVATAAPEGERAVAQEAKAEGVAGDESKGVEAQQVEGGSRETGSAPRAASGESGENARAQPPATAAGTAEVEASAGGERVPRAAEPAAPRKPRRRGAKGGAERGAAEAAGGGAAAARAGAEAGTAAGTKGAAPSERTPVRQEKTAEPAVNEFKGERWPGFEDVKVAEDTYDSGAVKPPSAETNRYVVEIEPGKQVVVDQRGAELDVHGKYASATGYKSIRGMLEEPPKAGSEREFAEGRALANYVTEKTSGRYASVWPPSRGPAEISLPYWAGKPVLDALKRHGWALKTERGGISGHVYQRAMTEIEYKRLGKLGFMTNKGTVYADETELAKKLDEALTKATGSPELFDEKPATKQQKRKAIAPRKEGIEGEHIPASATKTNERGNIEVRDVIDVDNNAGGGRQDAAEFFGAYPMIGDDGRFVIDQYEGTIEFEGVTERGEPAWRDRDAGMWFIFNADRKALIYTHVPPKLQVTAAERRGAEIQPTQKQIEVAAHEAATSPKNELPQPTQAQKEAENYKVGEPVKLYGVTWRVENPKGSYRFKFDEKEFTGIFLDAPRGLIADRERERTLDFLRSGRIPEAFKEANLVADHMQASANEVPQMRRAAKKMDTLLKSSWFNKMPAHYARALGIRGADGDTLDAFLGPKASDQTLPVYVIDTNKRDTKDFDEHKVMIGYDSEKAARADFDASYGASVARRIFRAITPMPATRFEEWAKSGDLKKPAEGSMLALEKTNERAEPAPAEGGQPTGAQPEGVPRAREEPQARRVRENKGEGGAPGVAEPGTLGLFDERGVGEGAERISATAGPAAADFGRDRRAGRDIEGPERDGRSSESRRARSAGPTAAARDYVIARGDKLGEGGPKTKARQNLDAIRIVKQIIADNGRAATTQEQEALVKYVGWGGMPQIFDAEKAEWAKEHAELKELLTPDEYAAARRSTQDAHYTSDTVVRGIYDALTRLGLKSGKVLEPSAGIGHFFGLMPTALRASVQPTGVELDPMTAAIAQALYPSIKVHQQGFQDFAAPDGFYDAVVGNPPFGDQKVFDAERRALNDFSIHNYFIAKAVDLTRPGGVVGVVVSRYFMDAVHSRARTYIASRANLLGAIRLPNTAFLDNANTEVVTDLVFLQKKAEPSGVISGIDWTGQERIDVDGQKTPINRYFTRHPEMVLGKHALTGKMYRGNDYTVEPSGDLEEQLRAAIAKLPENVVTARAAEPQATLEQAVTEKVDQADVKNVEVYGFFEKDGRLLQRVPNVAGEAMAEPVEIEGAARERMLALIGLRDTVREQLRLELADDPVMDKNRRELNKRYDQFVRQYGYLHAQGNKNVFSDDPSYPLLAALELDYDRGVSASTAKAQGVAPRAPSAGKAAIFGRRVLVPFHAVTKVSNASDALAASLAERGRIDADYIEQIYKPLAAAMDELGERVYERTDGSGWETADAYLSGNVKAKLNEAARAAERDERFKRNVDALTRVIPADLEPVDISIHAASPWVPEKHLVTFAKHLLGENTSAQITYVPALGKFSAKIYGGDRVLNSAKWGTERVSGADILESYLRGTPVKVYDKVGENSVLNADATMAANEKLEQIKREFQSWVWDHEERRTELARIYNDRFNTDVERVFDGSHLGRSPNGDLQPLPGATPTVELRPHQRNFVWRFIQEGRNLGDHVVGAGKTYASISAVMERKRLGLINKPMFTVPNHLVDQWASDFTKLYPGARVLAATKKDFEKQNRRRFLAKIATGDWDAVIIAHSSFGFIGMPMDTLERFIAQQTADIETSKEALSDSTDRRSVKQLEKAKERLEQKFESQIKSKSKDKILGFDELGVDALVVDEAHMFKNLMYATSLGRNVAGLGSQDGSQRAMDLFVKVLHVLERNAQQNVLFLTGTPISNSIAEMYTMQRYLGFNELRSRGLAHFDAWAQTFADAVADWEIKASGQGYELKTRFRAFQNFPELMKMYRAFADVVTQQDLKRMRAAEGKPSLTPPVATGGPQNMVVPRSPWQASYMSDIVKRADNLKNVDPTVDNMLKITNDARKMALDMRLIDPEITDYEKSKTNDAARRIKSIYDEWKKHKGTQLVFIDLSTPKSAQTAEQARIADVVRRAEEGDEAAADEMAKLSPDDLLAATAAFDVYNDLKHKLVALGIPEREVEFIHSANTELQKEALFERTRQGITRVLLGSTAKMGAGMNVQRRLVALHHLDAPWRPSDLEQREGRIIRQGNMFYEGDPDRKVAAIPDFAVSVYRYATEQTYDSRMWQTIENKAKFIEQARHANLRDRRVEDIGGEAANAAAMKAAASGNPLIEEEIKLRSDIKKLDNLEREHTRSQHAVQRFIKNNADIEGEFKKDLALVEQDIAQVQPVEKGKFAGISVRGKEYDERKKGGLALALEIAHFIKSGRDSMTGAGKYRGFDFYLTKETSKSYGVVLEGHAGNYGTYVAADKELDPIGLIARLDHQLDQMPARRDDLIRATERKRKELVNAQAEVGKPFAQAEELATKMKRHAEVLKELSAKKEEEKKDASEGLSPRFGDQQRGGLGVNVIEPFARAIAEKWKGLTAQVVVTTRRDLARVPENVRRGIEHLDPRSRMMGVTDHKNGVIYLFADNLPSLMEAERILVHEGIGHAGVEAFLGDRFPRYRDLALRAFPKLAVEQALHIQAKLSSTDGRNRVGREIIATLAERVEAGTATARMQQFWDRLVAAFRNALAALGIKHFQPGPVEIRNMIRDAARTVREGPLAEGSRVPALGDVRPTVENLTAALTDPDNEEDLNRRRADESQSRADGFFKALKEGQPLDRAFAQPFRLFGTIDERRVFHLNPRAKAMAAGALKAAKDIIASKRFQWMHGMVERAHNSLNDKYNVDEVARNALETVKRGIIDRYGQSEELRTRSLQVDADRRSILLQGEDLLKRLIDSGVESKEAEIMYRMMTVDGASDEERAQLGEEITKLAPEIRDTITHMGREYVELGLLDPATFEYWKETYLPRSYLRHEMTKSSLARAASSVLDSRRKRIIGRQFRKRGVEIVKSQERILRDVPEDWWGRRKELGSADKSLVGEDFVVLEKREAPGDMTIDIPGMEPKKVKERVTSRVYYPAGVQIPNKYAGYDNLGNFRVTGIHRGDVTLWRDWTREERERMTEIVDVRYAVAKAFMQAANDISNGRYFRDIAQNQDWASKTDPTGHSPDASERLWSVQAGDDWVRVPETKVTGTDTTRYGALAGMYVRSEVWNDINQLMHMQKAGFWKMLLKEWKLNKTARNPVVHLNNIMSNVVLMDLVDVRARDLVRGIRQYVSEDAHYRSALEHGAFGADQVTNELKNTLLGPVLREIEQEKLGQGMGGAFAVIGRVYTALHVVDAKMRDIYQMEDEVFRMATYMREIERGATPAAAALHAREQFLNYDIRAPWVNALRQSVMPFLAYSYRAVPVVARSIADRPWKLAKYFTLAYLFNMLAYMVADDDDEDEERATLRPEEQGYTWLGVPRMIRSPFNDRFDNPIFWDIRRFLPAGDVFDLNQGSSAIPVPAPLQLGGPIQMAFELMLNKAGFTGEPITDELTDSPGEKFAKVGDYLWKSFAPSAPWIPGSWYWNKIEAAATGALDPRMREYSVPLAISSSLGLKLKPHDVELERSYRYRHLDAVERALTDQMRSLTIDLGRHRVDRGFYDRQVQIIQAKLADLNEQRKELAPR